MGPAPKEARYDGPLSESLTVPDYDVAWLMKDKTFSVKMDIETGSAIDGDPLLLGTHSAKCSGLYFL